MEIQRQSDYYGLDNPAPKQANLSAEQVRNLTAGPQITPGLLNTRQAFRYADSYTVNEPVYPSGAGGGSFGDMTIQEVGGTAIPSMPMALSTLRGGLQSAVANEIGFGASATGQEQTPDFNPGPAKTGYHYASEVHNDLLQAEGEEIEAVGLYNQFVEDAQAAGDDHAAAAFQEAIHDEMDHAHNFGEALRQGYRY